ncbi:MAG: response regulator transcription factor [Ignavibacteriaceae bacterium]
MRVVVVDDAIVVRERLIKMFSEIPSLAIVGEAGNSFEALNIIKEKHPDVVVLDIKMPGDSGIEVLRRIKKKNSSIIVIVLTNYPLSQYRAKCFEYGADYFFDKSEEYSKVTEVLRTISESKTCYFN